MADSTPKGWLFEVQNAGAIWALISKYEGIVPWMYLDTHGLVTAGVGILIPSARFAISYPFVLRDTREPASVTEIGNEYAKVSRQPAGMSAKFYRTVTRLELPYAEIRKQFDKIITSRIGSLRKMYAGFDDFPFGPKMALLDMIFQLGPGGLRSNWPSLNKAIQAKNWTEASKQSHRRESSAARNLETSALFLSGTVRNSSSIV